MHFNILSFVLSLGVFQGLFMSILLLVIDSRNAKANRILAFLLTVLSFLLATVIFLEAGYPDVDLIRLLQSPLLFLL